MMKDGGEILFPRKTDFQLIDIKNKSGIIYVKLEEVQYGNRQKFK